MSFRLKEATFKVRCREPGCPFNSEFIVKENIMGATEADVDSEALKIAKNLGFIKHDAVYGRSHQLQAPDVTKVSATYDRIGTAPAPQPSPAPAVPAAPAVPTKAFRKGEVIVKRGDSAATVCEVIRGYALNEKLPDLHYKAGSTFGAAAIFRQKNRMVDIVAGEDGTTIAYYNIKDIARTNPAKARELYDEAMEDVFHILGYLETYAAGLEKKVARLEAAARASAAKPTKPAARKARKPARKAAKKAGKPKKSAKKPARKAARKPSRKPARKAARRR